ncbi:outer membrane protein assembly factor BamB family protein [Streptomyces hiroshimensis]|uniref:Pyrrolo-quinoline quinone repeat domain-containing protein n=1 Tax=Streptomyces hiroshimensis TaxID=66424 RepID=A0ABQ2ZEQ4_9ACTN|nr:PQQ-binding-like beta-propeller repeat protein [Streptomyces hiroshimensis]GGY11450.1 hypothetical protein GCM10010324_67730 [Streptomyces hiroshimensis]
MVLNPNIRRPSRRAFLLAAAGVLGAGTYAGWELLCDEGVPAPALRRPLWTFEADDDLRPGVARDGHRLIASTRYPPRLLAVDAASGRGGWRVQVGKEYREGGPIAVAGGTVYQVADDGVVRAHRAEDGQMLWSAGPVGAGSPWTPVVLGSTVCVHLMASTGDEGPFAPGVMCGLDAATGRERWSAPPSRIFTALPKQQLLLARTGELAGAQADTRSVGALDPRTGMARWKAPAFGQEDAVALAPDGGAVYLLDEQHRLCAYSTEAGERRWRADAMDGVITATKDGSTVYVCTYRGELAAFDAASGEQRWRRTVTKDVCRPIPVQHDGRVFLTSGEGLGHEGVGDLFGMGGERGYVLALSADSGEKLWRTDRLQTCWSAPCAAGDDVIVAHDSAMWAYNARTGKPAWRLATGDSSAGSFEVISGVLYGIASKTIQAVQL